MIRVLIVDDHAVVRLGVRRILSEANINVVGEAANGIEALKKLTTGKPDIVLLDISMPEENGFDTLRQIMDGSSGAKVLILSMSPEDQYAVRLLKAGASGYMTKDSAPEQLVEAIHLVFSGHKYISSHLAELLLKECRVDSDIPTHEILSNREYQVLLLLGSGKRVGEIAEKLSLSVKTVSTYRAHILEKMKLRNNTELTCYVVQNRLISPPSTQ